MFIGNDFVYFNVFFFVFFIDDMKLFWFGFSDCKKNCCGKSEKCGNNVMFVFWFWVMRVFLIFGLLF